MEPRQGNFPDRNQRPPRGRLYMDIARPAVRPVEYVRPHAAPAAAVTSGPVRPEFERPAPVRRPDAVATAGASPLSQPISPASPVQTAPEQAEPTPLASPVNQAQPALLRRATKPHGKSSAKRWLVITVLVVIVAAAAYAVLSRTAILGGATKTTTSAQAFTTDFAACKPVKYVDPSTSGQLIPEILGKTAGGCRMRLSYAGTPTAVNRLPGSEMTCVLDNTVQYAVALGAAYDQPLQRDCAGSLVQLIMPKK